ncbi:MAG: NAD-dependent epimerase/dehydratase family protein [Rhodopseudomonas sp.]|nr:NAD-dependent epimerase/dehydratase family protein [Rhodopseudomonas sp.]
MSHTIFITGAAGYVGAMLCDRLSQRDDVGAIVALDKSAMPDLLRGNGKIRWIAANTVDDDWQDAVAAAKPDIAIHAAWQIRDIYGQAALRHAWNVDGARRVIDFAFATGSIERLIHFSSVSPYGARADNSRERAFTESDELRADGFAYADEKRTAEIYLAEKFQQAQQEGNAITVAVLRPAAITGPRGRSRRSTFSLQSALSGQLGGKLAHRLVTLLVSVMPVTPRWSRQFVHEDDITDIVALLAFGDLAAPFDHLTACPPGDAIGGADMARAFGKRRLCVPPQLVRLAFFLAWHLSRGRIPTSPGAWRHYSYPVVVDGSKLTRCYQYQYRMAALDALTQNVGHYASVMP